MSVIVFLLLQIVNIYNEEKQIMPVIVFSKKDFQLVWTLVEYTFILPLVESLDLSMQRRSL